MNSKAVAGIIAVIVVIGAIYFATQGKNESDVASDTESAQSATETKMENGSIKSLIAASSTRKCTFKTSENGTESSGTIYTADGKMRGDFTTTVDGAETMSHMIYDGTTSHVWVDGQSTGFKMALDASQADDKSGSGSIDTNKNFEFDCDSWSADNSKFSPPSDIQFSELPTVGAGMSSDAQTSAIMNSSEIQKAACNSLPEPAKAQCLAAIQ